MGVSGGTFIGFFVFHSREMYFILIGIALLHAVSSVADGSTPSSSSQPLQSTQHKKYLLYEVGMGEGFNLRCDVHIRMATLAMELNRLDVHHTWVLVLPSWCVRASTIDIKISCLHWFAFLSFCFNFSLYFFLLKACSLYASFVNVHMASLFPFSLSLSLSLPSS